MVFVTANDTANCSWLIVYRANDETNSGLLYRRHPNNDTATFDMVTASTNEEGLSTVFTLADGTLVAREVYNEPYLIVTPNTTMLDQNITGEPFVSFEVIVNVYN